MVRPNGSRRTGHWEQRALLLSEKVEANSSIFLLAVLINRVASVLKPHAY